MTEQEDVAGVAPATEKVGSGDTASVGQRLRAAREAAGMSVADVAMALKYGARQIEQLEADDYASLPGATVVRGFTRSYARLLGLEADQLLRQLDALTPSALADVRPPENMGIAENDHGLSLSPVVSAAIVLAIAAVLLVLWHFFGPRPAKPAAGGERPPHVQAQPQEAASTAPLQPPAALSAPAAGTVDAAPTLVFEFNDRSWLEVTDADRQILHTGENPAGSSLTLTGKPPFDIVVGNAGKVRLTYGDRLVDLAPHTRAEVARLKLE